MQGINAVMQYHMMYFKDINNNIYLLKYCYTHYKKLKTTFFLSDGLDYVSAYSLRGIDFDLRNCLILLLIIILVFTNYVMLVMLVFLMLWIVLESSGFPHVVY